MDLGYHGHIQGRWNCHGCPHPSQTSTDDQDVMGLHIRPMSCFVHLTLGLRAASTSSSLASGVVCGASLTFSGSSSASFAISIMAWQNSSSVSLLSDSGGSIMIASSTTRGKFTVGG